MRAAPERAIDAAVAGVEGRGFGGGLDERFEGGHGAGGAGLHEQVERETHDQHNLVWINVAAIGYLMVNQWRWRLLFLPSCSQHNA